MIKNNKLKAILSSVVILLPILFGVLMWKQLPANMTSHWGADGVPDGTMPKALVVFGMPLILLALHWLMLLAETVLQKKTPQNPKLQTVQYLLIPILSLVVNSSIYSVTLGKDWNLFVLVPLVVGGMFVYIGNYLPKTTRNRTMGIKLRWTMGNDENWQKTHRLGGQLWFWSGLVILVSALLPVKVTIILMIPVIIANVVVPTVYSYSIYKKHKAEGIKYEPVFTGKGDKIARWITAICVPLVLIGASILMFTGSIEIVYEPEQFQIIASYADDLTVRYDKVDSVEYLENFDIGSREMGFGSARLSTGIFNNDTFGRYTLYAYTGGEGAVVLKRGDDTLVIVAKTAEETKAIYDALAVRIK